MINHHDSRTGAAGGNAFSQTHWSVVLTAGDGASPGADAALESLCRAYWQPLYAYVCRKGCAPHDAQDLIQEFFSRLLEKQFLRAIDPRKGRFRSFLIAALEHFLANQRRRQHAQKRGGMATFISLDEPLEEGRPLQIAGAGPTPQQLFEQQWAVALLDQVLARLKEEFAESGKERLFEETKIFLTGDRRPASYRETAARLEMTEAALKMAVSRMRHRYGELLRLEIARTVNGPEEVAAELRTLFDALSA